MRELVQKAAGDESTQIEEQSFENELLKYCRELYSTKTCKILPPSETARRGIIQIHTFLELFCFY